ncbi:MAG: hypothetical protein JST40_11420, partial [Armatimonadetes bacterium]|nr:hypothetical protein [Armatimonadota bacterium]
MKNTVLIAISLYCGAAQAAPQYHATELQSPDLGYQIIRLSVNCGNGANLVAGTIIYLENSVPTTRIVVWRSGSPEVLSVPNSPNQLPSCVAVHQDGSILIRDANSGAAYWYKDGVYTQLQGIDKTMYVQQANQNRQLALLLNSNTFQDQAALWQNDVITPLNGIGYRSRAYGILEDGTVIGNAEQPNQFG